MKKYDGIDYSFRPESYWEDSSVLQSLLRDVKGVQRRRMIIDYYENGAIDQLDDTILEAKLSEDQRKRFGAIHPSFMGGEYLPDLSANETEIARIELRSTLADVISIRAKCEDGTYAYSVVDEHEDSYNLFIEIGFKPFSLEELILFIDSSEQKDGWPGGLALSANNANAQSLSRNDLEDFTTVSSDIYLELENHYSGIFEDWACEAKA